MIGPFFENHVLGIMALLADAINDGKGPQPLLEKLRCLKAIREMITLARSHVSSGLPQVMSPSSVRAIEAYPLYRYVLVYARRLKMLNWLTKAFKLG